MDRPF